MADFRVDVFKGIRPRIADRLKPVGEATEAENLRLGSGAFEPFNSPLKLDIGVSSAVRTLFRVRNNGNPFWLYWNKDIDVVRGPVVNDDQERIYYTGESEPRMTYLGIIGDGTDGEIAGYRKLGIPAPETAAEVAGDELPADAVTGTVAGFLTPNLKADFTIDQGLPHTAVNSWYMALTDGGGAPSDNGYEPNGTTRTFAFDFPVGLRLRVSQVIDENTVEVESADSRNYVAAGVDRSRSGQTWFRTEDTGTTRAGFFRFYLPNGTKLTITGHALEEGDVIRVTSVPSPIGITFTAPSSVTPTGGHFFGWESDNSVGSEDTNTWPSAPTSVAADSFYYGGARSYPFVDVWVDQSGPESNSSFNIDGEFTFQLVERGGVDYDDITSNIESRVYVYTFVSALGEEGPPSPPSEIVTIPNEGSVVVSNFDSPPTDGYDITHIRIYRANTGSRNTEFQFVAEIETPFDPFEDNISSTDLGEVLQTESWEPPPEDLEGLVALPNGVLAGFVGKTIYFSEPYHPHAWPPEYQKSVDHDLVGLGVLPNGVAVLTVGPVYIAAGDHPRAMSLRHFTASQACVSKLSITSSVDSVIYASPDGLASVGAGGFKLLTESYVRKKEWQADFSPTTIRGFWHDDKYFGFHSGGGFVFSPDDDSVGWSTIDLEVRAGYLDAETDSLYVVVKDDSLFAVFTESGEFTPTEPAVDVLVVGGGGAGGGNTVGSGGGGGGEVVMREGYTVTPGVPISVVVGAGGVTTSDRGGSGGDSSFDTLTAKGGGGGGAGASDASGGGSGGSGGGGGSGGAVTSGGTSTAVAGWGNDGGDGRTGPGGAGLNVAGGGGGAGEAGEDAELGVKPGDGGDGVDLSSIFGTDVGDNGWFGGGGAGGAAGSNVLNYIASGGRGGGGDTGVAGQANTGGGGGGRGRDADNAQLLHQPGGSGVVIVKSASAISLWDGDSTSPMTARWKRRFVCPYPLNLSCARVVAGAYPVTVRIWNDRGGVVAERVINDDGIVRLPGGYLTSEFDVEVEGSNAVYSLHLGETVEELLQG